MPGPYTYSDTPLATDAKNTTQPLIRNNFLGITGAFSIDHVAINAASDWGKHNFVTLPEQAASPTTLVNEGAIFSRQGALSSVTELCFRRESNGSVIEFTGTTAAEPGWTRLPSGILIKWGTSTANGYTLTTFPVAATVPAFTSIFTVLVTTYGNAAGNTDTDTFARIDSYTITNFYAYGSARTTTGAKACNFSYLAIGV